MTLKALLSAAAICVCTASAGIAMCSYGHQQAAMTCAAGTVYDADSNSCKVISG